MSGSAAPGPSDQPPTSSERRRSPSFDLGAVLESISDPVVAYDHGWHFLYYNPAAADLFRRTGGGDQIIGRALWDVYPQIAGTRLESELRGAAEEAAATDVEVQSAVNGSWISLQVYPTSFGCVVHWRDITDRKNAEAAREESESRFRLLADVAPVLIWMADRDGRCDFFNHAWLEFTGRDMERELGEGWIDSVHPEDLGTCRRAFSEALARREPITREYRLRHRDGSYRWVVDHGVPRYEPTGEFAGFVGSCMDIHERRRDAEVHRFLAEAGRVLVSSLDHEETLQSVARLAVPALADWCAIDLVTEDGLVKRLAVAHKDPAKVEWAHQIGERYPPDMSAAVGLPKVLRTGDSEIYSEVSDELLQHGARDAEHLEILRQVGMTSVMIVPLRARDRVLGAISLISAEQRVHFDADDLALAEDLARRAATAIDNARLFRQVKESRALLEEQAVELEESAAQLTQLNQTLMERTAEAETANRTKSDFLAMMSHELRTPLNAIGGYAELMLMGLRGPVTAEQQEDLRRVQASQRVLLAMISDILNFAKIEGGHVRYEITDVPLHSALSEVVSLVEPQCQQKGVACEVVGGDEDVTVRADEEKLQQIVLNLMGNAVKFTQNGGVRLSWVTDGDLVRIQVSDTGAGIPEDRLESIFEPFFQVERNFRRAQEGTGLGLSISRDMARAMGGEIVVHSTIGQGSTFEIVLPRGA